MDLGDVEFGDRVSVEGDCGKGLAGGVEKPSGVG